MPLTRNSLARISTSPRRRAGRGEAPLGTMNASAVHRDKVAGPPGWTGDDLPALSTRLRLMAAVALAAVLGSAILLMDASAQDRSQNQDRSPVYDVANGDPEMAAAIAKARSTLPVFWASYEAPKASEEGHSLK